MKEPRLDPASPDHVTDIRQSSDHHPYNYEQFCNAYIPWFEKDVNFIDAQCFWQKRADNIQVSVFYNVRRFTADYGMSFAIKQPSQSKQANTIFNRNQFIRVNQLYGLRYERAYPHHDSRRNDTVT